MRARLFLAFAALLDVSGLGAHAQTASEQVPIVTRGGGLAGTGLGVGSGAAGVQTTEPRANRARSPVVTLGTGRIGAGTGGTSQGLGNAVGGINNTAIGVGTGGLRDLTSWGSDTGGVNGTGRGLSAGAGGLKDSTAFGTGINSGGINGSAIGAGTGGLKDLNSLGATTGGVKENNAQRFRLGQ